MEEIQEKETETSQKTSRLDLRFFGSKSGLVHVYSLFPRLKINYKTYFPVEKSV